MLENLGVARGCWHYRDPNPVSTATVPESEFSNEELALAPPSPSLRYSPHTIRVGAAMLGADGNDAEAIISLAMAENCVAVVRYIANAALRFEPESFFWRQLLDRLPESPPINEGVMPHPTRFVAMTGMPRAGVHSIAVWIRPLRGRTLAHG